MAGISEKRDSCVFRIQRSGWTLPLPDVLVVEGELGLSRSSKYTPARPEVIHAAVTAKKPLRGDMVWMVLSTSDASEWLADGAEDDWIWTIPTPMARRKRASHLILDSRRRSMTTENAAVVRIFIWYVTWKVATSRLDAAVYWRLFWMT